MHYPLLMKPAFKDYLWGGSKLVDQFGKQTSLRPLAESWEISCHPDGLSFVTNGFYAGQSLASVLLEHPEWISENKTSGFDLPILVKLIDAKDKLSLQVHPADEWSLKYEAQPGKNEMWYVLDAEPDAELILGLKENVTRDRLLSHINDNTILELVNRVKVEPGDCYCVPAGMIHGIGSGVLVAEVQQSSNVTYRVFDYDRRDADGVLRPLHIKEASEVINLGLQVKNCKIDASIVNHGLHVQPLTDWRYFTVDLVHLQHSTYVINAESTFIGLLVLSGSCRLQYQQTDRLLYAGDSIFLPAGLKNCLTSGNCKLLQIRL